MERASRLLPKAASPARRARTTPLTRIARSRGCELLAEDPVQFGFGQDPFCQTGCGQWANAGRARHRKVNTQSGG